MKYVKQYLAGIGLIVVSASCATAQPKTVTPEEAAKLDRGLVKEAVVYEPGTKDGAVVPEISAPRLRVTLVPDRVEGNRLIEKHREWLLEGDVSILGIPHDSKMNSGNNK